MSSDSSPHSTPILTQLIRLCLYALLFLTPFIFLPYTSELFEFPKMIFIYAFTIIIFILWSLHIPLYKKLPFQHTPFDLPILIFLCLITISTIFSIDPFTSIWGYYSRFHGGLGSLIAFVTLLYATATFIKDKAPTYTNILIASSTILSIIAIAQHFGIDAHIWKQDVQNRVFSTLGQPNWLAAYLTAVIPLTWLPQKQQHLKHLPLLAFLAIILLIFSATTPRFLFPSTNLILTSQITTELILTLLPLFILSILNYKTNVSPYFYSSTIYLALLYSKSRSGFLAFIASYLLFWSISYYKSNKKNLTFKRLIYHSIPLAIISIIAATPYSPSILNQIAHTPSSQIEEPTNLLITDSGDIRKIVWKGAWKLGLDYPLLGTGPETFAYSYYFVRPAEHNLVSEWDFLYNKAHNEYLNYWATTGILGTLAYLIVITIISLAFIKKIYSSTNTYQTTALLSGYVAILITNFFGFSVVAISTLFWTYPAFAFSSNKHYDTKTNKYLTIILPPLLLIVSAYMLIQIFNIFQSDIYYGYAKKLYNQNEYEKSNILITQAIDQNPDQAIFYDFASKVTADLSIQAFYQQDATNAAQLANYSNTYATIATQKNPYNPSFWKNKASTLITLSTLDPLLIQQAISDLQTASLISPTDPKITYNLALLYARQKDYAKAIEALNETIQLKPNYDRAYFARATYYHMISIQDQNIINQEYHNQAINDLKKYLELNPGDTRIQEQLQLWQTEI